MDNSRFPNFFFGSWNFCTYCGDLSDEGVDHVVAVESSKLPKYLLGPRTGCCYSCRMILRNKIHKTFDDRCHLVQRNLNSKAKAVYWTEKQVRELDYTLATSVRQYMNHNLWLRERADWYGSIDFYKNIGSLLYEPCLDYSSPRRNDFLFEFFQSITDELRSRAVQ